MFSHQNFIGGSVFDKPRSLEEYADKLIRKVLKQVHIYLDKDNRPEGLPPAFCVCATVSTGKMNYEKPLHVTDGKSNIEFLEKADAWRKYFTSRGSSADIVMYQGDRQLDMPKETEDNIMQHA